MQCWYLPATMRLLREESEWKIKNVFKALTKNCLRKARVKQVKSEDGHKFYTTAYSRCKEALTTISTEPATILTLSQLSSRLQERIANVQKLVPYMKELHLVHPNKSEKVRHFQAATSCIRISSSTHATSFEEVY